MQLTVFSSDITQSSSVSSPEDTIMHSPPESTPVQEVARTVNSLSQNFSPVQAGHSSVVLLNEAIKLCKKQISQLSNSRDKDHFILKMAFIAIRNNAKIEKILNWQNQLKDPLDHVRLLIALGDKTQDEQYYIEAGNILTQSQVDLTFRRSEIVIYQIKLAKRFLSIDPTQAEQILRQLLDSSSISIEDTIKILKMLKMLTDNIPEVKNALVKFKDSIYNSKLNYLGTLAMLVSDQDLELTIKLATSEFHLYTSSTHTYSNFLRCGKEAIITKPEWADVYFEKAITYRPGSCFLLLIFVYSKIPEKIDKYLERCILSSICQDLSLFCEPLRILVLQKLIAQPEGTICAKDAYKIAIQAKKFNLPNLANQLLKISVEAYTDDDSFDDSFRNSFNFLNELATHLISTPHTFALPLLESLLRSTKDEENCELVLDFISQISLESAIQILCRRGAHKIYAESTFRGVFSDFMVRNPKQALVAIQHIKDQELKTTLLFFFTESLMEGS